MKSLQTLFLYFWVTPIFLRHSRILPHYSDEMHETSNYSFKDLGLNIQESSNFKLRLYLDLHA